MPSRSRLYLGPILIVSASISCVVSPSSVAESVSSVTYLPSPPNPTLALRSTASMPARRARYCLEASRTVTSISRALRMLSDMPAVFVAHSEGRYVCV